MRMMGTKNTHLLRRNVMIFDFFHLTRGNLIIIVHCFHFEKCYLFLLSDVDQCTFLLQEDFSSKCNSSTVHSDSHLYHPPPLTSSTSTAPILPKLKKACYICNSLVAIFIQMM